MKLTKYHLLPANSSLTRCVKNFLLSWLSPLFAHFVHAPISRSSCFFLFLMKAWGFNVHLWYCLIWRNVVRSVSDTENLSFWVQFMFIVCRAFLSLLNLQNLGETSNAESHFSENQSWFLCIRNYSCQMMTLWLCNTPELCNYDVIIRWLFGFKGWPDFFVCNVISLDTVIRLWSILNSRAVLSVFRH